MEPTLRKITLVGIVLLALTLVLAGCSGPQKKPDRGAQASTNLRQPVAIDPQQRQEVIMTALGLLDVEYSYGGAHPSLGFDCSGLVAYVFDAATAHKLPHNTAQIASISRPVSKSQLRAGDLVFFNTLNRPNSHMGIYLGDGQFINAPSSGGRVRIDSLHNPWFASRYTSARSLFR
ncbi:MAG: C40 family peptidase [Burkholderiaceae bacterium]|nr:C40 family peptidase [Burkholderiaceae bacterium]